MSFTSPSSSLHDPPTACRPPHTLQNIPPELCRMIVRSLSARDIISLRLVSKAFHEYFTDDDFCHFALKLYYPTFGLGKDELTRKDFDALHFRMQRWKEGRPTELDVIDDVAEGSTGFYGFIVDTDAGLLAYQRSRGVVVIRDLKRTETGPVDTVINLHTELGECIMHHSSKYKDGESIRMRMNRGMLLVVGEAHTHQVDEEQAPTPETERSTAGGIISLSSWWNWALGVPSGSASGNAGGLAPRRFYQQPHTICAVFSTRSEDRGKLLHTWVEKDSFMSEAALNEFYAITEFDIIEQRLDGYIFPTKSSDVPHQTNETHDGYHFTLRKKAQYPPLSTFSIAPDTRGKVFYLGFIPPTPDRRPVVEVHSVPQYNPADGTWTPGTIIKRVSLRGLGRNAGSLNERLLNSSYWISFDDGTTIDKLKYPRHEPFQKFPRDPDEDVVRLRLRGDFVIQGVTLLSETVNAISWDITARPSPRPPAPIDQWRAGKLWADEESIEEGTSPYVDSNGVVDLEEVYPTPTYFTRVRDRQQLLQRLQPFPDDVDLDQLEHEQEMIHSFPCIWVKDDKGKNRTLCVMYSIRTTILPSDPGPATGFRVDGARNPEYRIEYPPIPGVQDHEFIPPGILWRAAHRVSLETGKIINVLRRSNYIGRKPRQIRFMGKVWEEKARVDDYYTIDSVTGETRISSLQRELPLPGFDDGRYRVLTWIDAGERKYMVYGKEAERRNVDLGEEKVGDKIVVVRFD
ncbi:hypothetical protein RUND412_002661 [Rhizina undulata]